LPTGEKTEIVPVANSKKELRKILNDCGYNGDFVYHIIKNGKYECIRGGVEVLYELIK
jgi:hypothetical protein